MPPAPLAVRGDAAVVWTGSELVVWGGDVEAFNMGLPGPDRSYRNGAALNPQKRTWRRMRRSPLPAGPDTAAGVMTDRGVVLARGREAALWRTRTNTWRSLDDAPGDVYDLAFTGSVVISASANAILEVPSGQWRQLPEPPIRLERPTATWTGRELVVLGGPETPFTPAAGQAYDVETDRWRQLPPLPEGMHAEALDSDWDGRRLIVVNYDMRAATYDPSTDSWNALSLVPARFYEWYPTIRSVSRARSAVFMAEAVVLLDDLDRWLPLPYDGIPKGTVATTRSASRTGVADGRLYVWGLEDDHNILVELDLDEMAKRPRRVQVGVVTLTAPAEYRVVATLRDPPASGPSEQESTALVFEGPEGTCRVASTYAGAVAPVEEPIHVVIQSDGRRVEWHTDAATWTTAATTSDTVTITCPTSQITEQFTQGTALPSAR